MVEFRDIGGAGVIFRSGGGGGWRGILYGINHLAFR